MRTAHRLPFGWWVAAIAAVFLASQAFAAGPTLQNFNRNSFTITPGGVSSNVIKSSTWAKGIHPTWGVEAIYPIFDPDIFTIGDINGSGENNITITREFVSPTTQGIGININVEVFSTNNLAESEAINAAMLANGSVATNGFYRGVTGVAVAGETRSNGGTTGSGIGVFGRSTGTFGTGYGVAGNSLATQDGMTNIGGAFAASQSSFTGITQIGVFGEVGDTTSLGAALAPVYRSAAFLAENKGSGLPYFIAQSSGTVLVTIDGDGKISLIDRSVSSGSGSPEGVVTAKIGSIYLRTDGASGTTLYTKVSGTGNTGWEVVGGGDQTITNLTVNNNTIFNGKVTINNNANIESLYVGGNTNVIDLSIATATNTISSAITFAHATNGLISAQRIHDRWFFVASGGPYTLTIPSTWRTNVYSAVPPSLTNSTITRMIVTGMGDTSTAAAQTNALVSFEFYK